MGKRKPSIDVVWGKGKHPGKLVEMCDQMRTDGTMRRIYRIHVGPGKDIWLPKEDFVVVQHIIKIEDLRRIANPTGAVSK